MKLSDKLSAIATHPAVLHSVNNINDSAQRSEAEAAVAALIKELQATFGAIGGWETSCEIAVSSPPGAGDTLGVVTSNE